MTATCRDVIVTSIDGAVATVTLNRPDRLNALDLPMWTRLGDAMESLAAHLVPDGEVRVCILRGAGGKAFAAGADIGEFETVRKTPAQAKDYDVTMRRALTLVRDFPAPVIAAIEGACVGGGLELACMCDLRIASASSRFGVPINRIGVVMAYPEIAGILRLVGPANALEILLEGQVFDVRKALGMGLINRYVEDSEFDSHIEETARTLSKSAPRVNAWHKAFIRRLAEGAPLTDADLDSCYEFLETEDYREGQAAFAEKRKPAFTGR